MSDEQVEAALRRYRPRAADPSLRSRVLASAVDSRVPLRAIDWALLTAAACLVIGVIWPDSNSAWRDPVTAAYSARVQQVADDLGGGREASQLAAIVIAAQPAPSTEEEW